VDCDDFREALSARLDSEEEATDADRSIDEHLEDCRDCAFWYDAAALITRRTRMTTAFAWPDVAESVLSRVPLAADRRTFRLRVALGGVGALELLTGVTALTSTYETGAWQVALGVTFGVVAWRDTPPAALVPLLTTLVAVLSWGQVTDLLSGGLSTTSAVSLLLAAAGLVLVVLLGRTPPVFRDPPAATTRSRTSRQAKPRDDGNTVTLLSARTA
jgi:predicted anti-sigma-YlaC factor YlaD